MLDSQKLLLTKQSIETGPAMGLRWDSNKTRREPGEKDLERAAGGRMWQQMVPGPESNRKSYLQGFEVGNSLSYPQPYPQIRKYLPEVAITWPAVIRRGTSELI